MKIIVSTAALADLRRLHSFLVGKSPSAAQRAVADLRGAIQSLDTFPERGRPVAIPHTRDLIVPFGRSAYVVRYAHRPQSDEVVVLRVWHGLEDRE